MPDDDAKEPKTETTDEEPKPAAEKRITATSDSSKSTAKEASASAEKKAPAKAKAKAKPAPVAEEEDDEEEEEDDEDEEDEEEEEEEDDEPPPPPKKKVGAKGKSSVPSRATRVAAARVAKRAVPPERHFVERKPVTYFLPYALGGMGLLAVHVFLDWDYKPVAVLGIALCVWAYIGIGSVNETKA